MRDRRTFMEVRRLKTDQLQHHGVKGQKWGVRRYQTLDGKLTSAGRKHYGYSDKIEANLNQLKSKKEKVSAIANTKDRNNAKIGTAIAGSSGGAVAGGAVAVKGISSFVGGMSSVLAGNVAPQAAITAMVTAGAGATLAAAALAAGIGAACVYKYRNTKVDDLAKKYNLTKDVQKEIERRIIEDYD